MSSIFFITDLPPDSTESTLRKLLKIDVCVAVSFRDSPTGPVAMMEARTAHEAERAAVELAQATLGGSMPLTVIALETPEGQQLGLLFACSEEHEAGACGRRSAYSACVLIVDDDAMCLQAMQGLVSIYLPQVCVHLAHSTDMALTFSRTRAFDAILIDVNMPGLEWFSLIAEMRRIRPHTPIVLMTPALDLVPPIVGSGAFGFMRKPVNRKYCVTVLQHAIMYCSLSKLVANAKQYGNGAVDIRAGLRWLAKAELGESLTRWNQE